MNTEGSTATNRTHGAFAIALGVVLLCAAAPARGSERLYINGEPLSSTAEYKGTAQLTFVPPFEDARLTVSIDGHRVASNLGRPYRVTVDLGPVAIEHSVDVSASRTASGKSQTWREVINPGSRPLAVRIRAADFANRVYEAAVTAPRSDPVVSVEFYDDNGLLQRFTSPPYRVQVPEASMASVIRATVKTRSGIEATDMIAGTENIHGVSYDVRTVGLLVSVSDRNGVVRTDLGAGSFEVTDNGTRGKIIGVGSAETQPISVALLLDASTSMTHVIDHVAKEAFGFAKKILRPQDQCSVYAVRTVPRREQPLTNDIAMIEKSMLGIKASGNTALYDAIRIALRELDEAEGRKAIILLTDGEDTSSMASHEQVLEAAHLAGVRIYVIAYNEVPEFAAARDRLAFLASETGGFLVSAIARDLARKYEAIERDLRAQYEIKYQVTDLAQPNEWRPVKVKVKSGELQARTISGYFTP